jgi:hypothetical protein
MNLRQIKLADRKVVREAMRIIDAGGRASTFRKNGFIGPRKGVYKSAYIKCGIVVKSGPSAQLDGEVKLWRKTYKVRYRRFRKHLARVFGIYKGWLFQRFIDGEQHCEDFDKCERIADIMGINDSGNHNHRHDSSGRPIWFDTNTYG